MSEPVQQCYEMPDIDDPELGIMCILGNVMSLGFKGNRLDPDAEARIARWFHDRYSYKELE